MFRTVCGAGLLTSSCAHLLKFAADADSVGLAIDTRVTNIDIVIARGKAAAGANARCRVIAAVLLKH